MLDISNDVVRSLILDGNFGLEKESLRVLEDGTFSHTLHPFPDDKHIVKDFCENQTEINTSVHGSAREAIEELRCHTKRICGKLQTLPEKEYLWPFSNPPYIENEKDIPVAVFEGMHVSKTAYRDYLSEKYGRYKMTFSGIHVNYSFSEELLKADYEWKKEHGDPVAEAKEGIFADSYQEYKDRLYLKLAKRMAAYGWILVAVTAASPILNSSFLEKGVYDKDIFIGMASVRCSEMGYWNEFAPIFNYDSIVEYVESIRKYVNQGLLKAPSELYYPVRIKPRGENNLETLEKSGADHIELRMFDLNPLTEDGVEEKDVVFAQLLMVWLAATPDQPFSEKDQIQAVHNLKNAAHYDLKTVRLQVPGEENTPVVQAALNVIDKMRAFYRELQIDVEEVLAFEYDKFADAQNRYAWIIREQYGDDFVQKALALAKERQEQ